VQAAWIPAAAVLITTVIAAFVAFSRNSESVHNAPPSLRNSVDIDLIDVVPQPVVDGGTPEKGTFRFRVHNRGTRKVTAVRAEFIPASISYEEAPNILVVARIAHDSHRRVFLDDIETGRAIPITFSGVVPPERSIELAAWFHLVGREGVSVRITGTITVYFEEDVVAATLPFDLLLYGSHDGSRSASGG
jgi:hypothetical protein